MTSRLLGSEIDGSAGFGCFRSVFLPYLVSSFIKLQHSYELVDATTGNHRRVSNGSERRLLTKYDEKVVEIMILTTRCCSSLLEMPSDRGLLIDCTSCWLLNHLGLLG